MSELACVFVYQEDEVRPLVVERDWWAAERRGRVVWALRGWMAKRLAGQLGVVQLLLKFCTRTQHKHKHKQKNKNTQWEANTFNLEHTTQTHTPNILGAWLRAKIQQSCCFTSQRNLPPVSPRRTFCQLNSLPRFTFNPLLGSPDSCSPLNQTFSVELPSPFGYLSFFLLPGA